MVGFTAHSNSMVSIDPLRVIVLYINIFMRIILQLSHHLHYYYYNQHYMILLYYYYSMYSFCACWFHSIIFIITNIHYNWFCMHPSVPCHCFLCHILPPLPSSTPRTDSFVRAAITRTCTVNVPCLIVSSSSVVICM
jgi:hypothetical protein